MTSNIYDSSVPVFRQMLGALDAILAKADAHVVEKNIDASALTQARLFPDMFPLSRQVQVACDFARGISARLAGAEVPKFDDKEQSFGELRDLIGRTLAFIGSLDESQFANAATREIVTRPGTPKERRFEGQGYLLSYGLPQFFFHVTTAYALLRHNGIEIGKRDYMGQY
ncbi:DUF1993 domain-containing protein [Rhodanobacter sp. L36]|uniref:DUF1993 domain-containing protein n=1 Tax=Rhodanobacter sp. L36 TaxID=1747221 RepID=UPI00131B45B6|nr:DUF1993 domain-containing protein [Rhodanobacter sp. L36]